ncbi:uncharacterized protein LOC114950604 [Scomber scombrus]|uniref:Uncharacterized protein LOC114950604 n=1 Tax=Scomber scombrus TaxID=13677 RepID=A0AAV1Q453_SCOSC
MKNKVISNPVLPAAGVRRSNAADGGAGSPSGGHHDDRTSNPGKPGRVLSDHSPPSNALMRCRRPFVMGTFNACTVREVARLVELAHCAEERGVEILGVQEHRRVHTDDQIVYHKVERCTFITSSAWRNEAQAAQGEKQYGEAWRVINEMTGRKRTKEGQVEGHSPVERMATWFNHFRSLLGSTADGAGEEIPSVLQNLDIDDGPFTVTELARAKATVRAGKSAGPDGIPPEVLKNCDLDDIMLEFSNLALLQNKLPDVWSLSNIIPVPKSGDLSKPDNYRGISLTCITAKIYNRMILNRIRSATDPHLRESQNGFRKGRSTTAQILALRRMIEEVKKDNLTAVLCFIDFKNAFDSIHRGTMVKILKAYGVPPNLLRAIETMHAGTRSKVVTPDGNTEEFDILAGVMQGDTLAPFLFIIVLDYALRKAISGREQDLGFTLTPRRSKRHPAVFLTDLDYADDISLLSNNCNPQYIEQVAVSHSSSTIMAAGDNALPI